MKYLNQLNIDETGVVKGVSTTDSIRRRFADIGITKGTEIKCVGVSPFGDPKAYLIRGAVIAIRNCHGKYILLEENNG